MTGPRKHYTESRFIGLLIVLVLGAYAAGWVIALVLPISADRATRYVYAAEVGALLSRYLREKDRP